MVYYGVNNGWFHKEHNDPLAQNEDEVTKPYEEHTSTKNVLYNDDEDL